MQVSFPAEALAVSEVEVGPPAVEDEIPLGDSPRDEPGADESDSDFGSESGETGVEQTTPRDLARHRRAGLVAERRAAKAERRRRRAEARLLRRKGADRVSAPLASGAGDEPAETEDEALDAERAEQERLEAERVEQERLEAERVEQERLEAERAEQERLEAERAEQERLDAERAELAAAHEAEAARESERQTLEREAEEQRLAEQAEAERLETEQAELEAAAEDARAKAEQAEQRERARQAKEAEREQAREAKDAERERRRAEKAERRAEKARAAAERRRESAPDALDDVPEPPDEVGSDRSGAPGPSRNVLALVAGTIGALGLLFSVLLAVGAFLVAVGTDDSGSLFSALSSVCDALTAPISGLISFSGENADKKEALVTWGLGAMVYLMIGLAAQSVLAKRTESVQA